MPIYLTSEQSTHIMDSYCTYSTAHAQAHGGVWKKRQYAPMYIYDDEMRELKESILCKFPEYQIVFDVVFESSGTMTDWHCDYESTGPFDLVDPLTAMRDAHLISIHFNLTPKGGCLLTMDSVWLSWLHYMVIVSTGIFSCLHLTLVWLMRPVFYLLARRHMSFHVGNVFNNLKLHAVAAGAPRTSYAIRLVRKGRVRVTRASIESSIRRSNVCTVFEPLYEQVVDKDEGVMVESIDWNRIRCRAPTPL